MFCIENNEQCFIDVKNLSKRDSLLKPSPKPERAG